MIKCVLFDLDGTLLDDERINVTNKIAKAKEFGYTITIADVLSSFGLPNEVSQVFYKEKFGPDFPYWEISNTKNNYVLHYMEKHGFPYKPYALETLDGLRKEGIRCGICTSTRRSTLEKYRAYGELFDHVDFILCGDETERGKPFPDIFLRGAELGQAKVSETAVVEDSTFGAKGALAAGMHLFLVPDLEPPDPAITSNPLTTLCSNLQAVFQRITAINLVDKAK
jgi:HAD superfamily hydrolase (TIGR01509 family)